MRHKRYLLTALIIALFFLSRYQQALPELILEGFAMDSYYRVKTNLAHQDQNPSRQWITAELSRLEQRYNIFDSAEFDLTDGETLKLQATAESYTELSGGAYRVDIAPLSKLWQEAIRIGKPPASDEVSAAVRLIEQGLGGLDFGSLLKGYATDQIYHYLESQGASKAIIDLGGTIRMLGRPSFWRSKWRVAIRNPEGAGSIGYFELTSGLAVATSGDYERGFVYQGRRYHHLIDPRSGFPTGNFRAVTVVAPDALTADILSTLLFITGPAEVSVVEQVIGLQIKALFIDGEGKTELFGSLPVRWVKNDK